jgi:predicted metal-dependent phosphoesterase TrpH
MLNEKVKEFLSNYKYKIELHAHTNPCSGCSRMSVSEVVTRLKESGYSAVVLTNHYFYDHGAYRETPDPIATYLKDYNEAKALGDKLGIKVFLAMEIRFLGSMNDYLVLGVDEQFLRDIYNRCELTVDSFYEEFHNPDRLIIQAHPFRNNGTPANLNSLDGLEIMNMHPDQKSRSAMAAKFANENNVPIVTIGTDLHHNEHVGICSLRTKTLPTTEKELVALLRKGDYIFDIGGYPMLPQFKLD